MVRRDDRRWMGIGLAFGALACGPPAPVEPEGAPSAALAPAAPPALEAPPSPTAAPGPPTEPAPAAAPPPSDFIVGVLRSADGTPLREGRRGPCAAHDDCAVVSGMCGGLYAVLAEDAADEARRNAEAARSAACARPEPAAAVPRCEAGACVAEPLDHPTWRLGCGDASGCVVVPRGCTGFDAVAPRHARAAERAWREDGCAPRPSPVPAGEAPDTVCSAGACALASE